MDICKIIPYYIIPNDNNIHDTMWTIIPMNSYTFSNIQSLLDQGINTSEIFLLQTSHKLTMELVVSGCYEIIRNVVECNDIIY